MRILAVVLAAMSAFFVFYTARLLVVTHFLQQTRAGGQGAFIGAVVFPLLALVLGWASVRCWRRATADADPLRAGKSQSEDEITLDEITL